MHDVIEWLEILRISHHTTLVNVQLTLNKLLTSLSSVMWTNAYRIIHSLVIITKDQAKLSPWSLKELIPGNPGNNASTINTSVHRGQKLSYQMWIKITVELHELSQVKLSAKSQSLTKIVCFISLVLDVDGELLGILVPVSSIDSRVNTLLNLIVVL